MKPVPITLPTDTLHTYIIGNTGMGKTTLERALIADTIQHGHGVCVLDPHGERQGSLVDCVLSDLPPHREQEVILFDIHNPAYTPGLKPFYCRDKDDPIAVQDTISTALNIFEKVYNVDRNTMARIIAYIEALIYLFIYDESLTLLDVPILLNPDSKYDKKRLQACTHLPPSPGFNFTRDFWTEEYSRRAKRGYNQDSEIFGTLMKFRELSSHLLWPMFCQKTNTLDMREIMQEQKILLVRLSGNWEDITSLLGTYLIGQIKDAAFHRTTSDPPFYLFADEFQKFASKDFLTLFSESRGGNLHVTIDHQVVGQLEPEMKETIRQASAFFCFRVTDISADQVGGMFDCSPRPGGVPRFEPLRTPVKEPIQHMLTHGVHPVDVVREFIDQYGNMLVEGEKLERDEFRRAQSINDRLYYSTSEWQKLPPETPEYPEYNCKLALHMLNGLCYQAMLYGKQGKDIASILITPTVLNYFIKATYAPGHMYLYYHARYQQTYPTIDNLPKRSREIERFLAEMPHVRTSYLYSYYLKKWNAYRICTLKQQRLSYPQYNWELFLAKSELESAIWGIDQRIKEQTILLEEEQTRLSQIAEAEIDYKASCKELTERIRLVMQALAKAPVEAPSGLMQEIPTELPTPEVEARIANELKLLPMHTARVRLNGKEAVITTQTPPLLISSNALQERKDRILKQNLTAGYLVLREDIEETFHATLPALLGTGHHATQPAPLPTPRRK